MSVPLLGAGIRSKSAVVTAQNRINVYLEAEPDEDKSKLVAYGMPGLTQRVDISAPTIRGGIDEGDLLYCVQGARFLEVNNAFVATERGAGIITTNQGKVSCASNGNVVCIADGTSLYTYTIATLTLALVVDPDLPANPVTVTWQDAQFAVTFLETGPVKQRVYISPDGTNWDALDFRAAESSPDALLRVYSDGNELNVLGTKTIEFWGYTGDADFPFAPIRGATLKIGLHARWSLAAGEQSTFIVGKSKEVGGIAVFEIAGHQARHISTPALDTLIRAYASSGDAVGFCHNVDGHTFYYLSFPTAGKSWVYDAYSSGLLGVPVWTQTTSNNGRYFAELGFSFLSQPIVSDYRAGRLHQLDADVFTDAGVSIERELDTRHFFKDADRVTVDALRIEMETGVGLAVGQGSDPLVMISVSRDGGRTFGAEQQMRLGKIGEFLPPLELRSLGTARDFVFKIRMTDPVKFVVAAMDIRATPGVN